MHPLRQWHRDPDDVLIGVGHHEIAGPPWPVPRRLHTDLCEHAGDHQVGPDILACGWRVHGDECFAVAPNTEIAPKAGVARCRRDAIRAESQLVVQPVTQQLESRVTNEWISVGKQTSL